MRVGTYEHRRAHRLRASDEPDRVTRRNTDVRQRGVLPRRSSQRRQAGRGRGLDSVVTPLLNHAEPYYLQPMDLMPGRLMGPAVAQRLDKIADDAMEEFPSHLRELWAKLAYEA